MGPGTNVSLTDEDVDDYVRERQKEGAGNARILKELQHLRAATRRAIREEPTWFCLSFGRCEGVAGAGG